MNFLIFLILIIFNLNDFGSGLDSGLRVDDEVYTITNHSDEGDLASGVQPDQTPIGTKSTIVQPNHSASRRQSLLKATCGYPGSPRNGRVLHLLERYEEGMVVTYECDPGYYLLGPMTRTCQSNSTWSNKMPICDQSMKNLGLTSASEALNNYPPQLAVDGNFRTCFFSNRRKPRWWRVELPQKSSQMLHNHSIISVALTLPPINAELFFSIYIIEIETLNAAVEQQENNHRNSNDTVNNNVSESSMAPATSSKYHKCATFRGVFSSKTIHVQCSPPSNGEGKRGLHGNFLQIEDDYPQLEYFGLCEVDVFVERDHYECGSVEVPAFGYVVEQQITMDGIRSVEYHCHENHRLVGDNRRHCDHRTGQWIGQEPYCERITCPEPEPLENSFHRVYGDYYDMPVVGTKTVYECRPGFIFTDETRNDTRICNQNGQWSGDLPRCEPIDCGHPESLLVNSEEFFLSGAQFRLINGTTHFTSIAELLCSTGDVSRGNLTRLSLWFRCREDGIWTEIQNWIPSNNDTNSMNVPSSGSCVKQRHNGFLYFYAYGSKNFFRKNFYIRETSVNILHLLAAVVIAAFLSIFIIVILLFKRNIIEWPATTEYCSQTSERMKSTGQSIIKFLIWIFVLIKSYIQYLDCCRSCRLSNDKTNQSSTSSASSNANENDNSGCKAPNTITVSMSSSDLESGVGVQSSSNNTVNRQSLTQSSVNDKIKLEHQENQKKSSDTSDLNTALATFYEEITNAAKQMFSEETDRKLIRAARIAAELDAIKNQSEQQSLSAPMPFFNTVSPVNGNNCNYQWIYATPPRYNGTTNTSISLPPSLHEYHQIVPTPTPSNSQIYAKVDLIRKHRYRKDKDHMIASVYQVPRPRQDFVENCLLDTYHTAENTANTPNHFQTMVRNGHHHHHHYHQNYHQLRKAVSTPDAVHFIAANQFNQDYSDEYGTIRRLFTISNKDPQEIDNNLSNDNNVSVSSPISTKSTPHIHEPINKNPLKTLL